MKLPESGLLAVISGPSGVGKTAVCDRLVAEHGCLRAVTTTTRAPRAGERDGVDYYFTSEEEFLAGVVEGKFLEHARVYGNLYGTPIDPLARQLEGAATVLLNIDVQGAATLLDAGVAARFCFLEPPSMEELARRLRERGSEDEEALRRRLETAREELEQASRYHHRVVNDDLVGAVEELATLLGVRERS